jgi:uncharacterized delta-60 repeat protein
LGGAVFFAVTESLFLPSNLHLMKYFVLSVVFLICRNSFSQGWMNDASFYTGSGANSVTGIQKMIQQSDGKILIHGSFTSYNDTLVNRLTRLNINGSIDTSFSSGSGPDNYIYSLLILPNGKIIIAGLFQSYNGYSYSRIARLNANGSIDLSFNPGTGADATISKAVLQPDGKIIICGHFTSFDGVSRNRIARLNEDGSLDMSFDPGTGANSNIYNSIVQPDGKLIVYGNSISTFNSAPVNNIFRLNSNGSLDSSFYTSSSSYQPISTAELQLDGKILVFGSFTEFNGVLKRHAIRLHSDGNLDSSFYSGNGFNDVTSIRTEIQLDGKIILFGSFTSYNDTIANHIIRLNDNGSIDTSFHLNDGANDWIHSISIEQTGNIVVAGKFTSFNGQLKNHISRLIDCIAVYSQESQITCDPFTWLINGQTYTTSGTYYDTLSTVNGCDSILILNLTIVSPTFGSETIYYCNSYIWPNNAQMYTASGTYFDTIPNANGCDSIITLNLTIFNSTLGSETVISCSNYIWPINGQSYTTSGTYSDTIPNANGCDSIITLDLTIVPSLPLSVNIFSQPSAANSCVGTLGISTTGTPDFTETIDGGSPITHSGYVLVENLCPGVHSLFTTNGCGDTLTSTFIIPVDSNYIFNNPFIDSIAVDSLGATIEDCDIYYNSIDTAFIDSIFANGNTVTVIWNIVDSNGSNFDTSTYVLNNGNGVYYLQLSVFCPTKSIGDYFAVTETIYFEDGTISTADLTVLDDDLFELFPNPTNDLVTIRFDFPKADLVMYDAQGKHIQTQTIISGDSISLSHLETGVYFFELITEQGKTVKRVVKQ